MATARAPPGVGAVLTAQSASVYTVTVVQNALEVRGWCDSRIVGGKIPLMSADPRGMQEIVSPEVSVCCNV